MRTSIWTSYLIDLTPEDAVRQFAGRGWRELELSNEHSAALLARGDPGRIGISFREYCSDLGVEFPQGHLWLTVDVAAIRQNEVLDTLKR